METVAGNGRETYLNVINDGDTTMIGSSPFIPGQPITTGMDLETVRAEFFNEASGINNAIPAYAPTETLYPPDGRIHKLLLLLQENAGLVAQALTLLKDDDLIGSDDKIIQLHLSLPELFCYRDIGDGFGVIINGLYHALQNNNGMPLSENRLAAINTVIEALTVEPFISFDDALEHLDTLEDAGFDLSPSEMSRLMDAIDALTENE